MSGVIDEKGMQWEHCNICGKLVRLTNLGYERPSTAYPHGRDIGICCISKVPDIEQVNPAPTWVPVYG